jgi:hypothetical protein
MRMHQCIEGLLAVRLQLGADLLLQLLAGHCCQLRQLRVEQLLQPLAHCACA